MSKLTIQDIITYLLADERLLADDPQAYDSYTIPDDTVVQIIVPGSCDPDYYTVTYVQVVNPTDKKNNVITGPQTAIVHLEGLPEDPTNINMDTDVDVRIYNQIL